MNGEQKPTWVRVWDPFVRISHWVLVAAFLIAYFAEDDFLSLHVWAGYTVGVVILVRIVWGFIGTEHARFKDFICSPIRSIRYLASLVKGRALRYLGHSPAGAAMVVMLMISILITGWSGLMVFAYEEQSGPLAAYVLAGSEITSSATHDERYEKDEEFWEETHEIFANVSLMLVLLHVLGVLLASKVHHENLIRSMFTGRKPGRGQEHQRSSDGTVRL